METAFRRLFVEKNRYYPGHHRWSPSFPLDDSQKRYNSLEKNVNKSEKEAMIKFAMFLPEVGVYSIDRIVKGYTNDNDFAFDIKLDNLEFDRIISFKEREMLKVLALEYGTGNVIEYGINSIKKD